jgi:hypothetical protein
MHCSTRCRVLNRIIEQVPVDQFKIEAPEAKWKKIFGNNNFLCLLLLIGTIFSVPVSNSFIETIFLLAKIQWTDSHNSLLPATVKALATNPSQFRLQLQRDALLFAQQERSTS